MNSAPARPAHSSPTRGAGPRVVLLAGLSACLLLLTACGVRLDGAPPEPAAPDAVEVARQEAARTADLLARTAEAVDPSGAEVTELLAGVAEASAAHREALGGVWEAWPQGAPEGAPSTPPPPAPPVDPEGADALEALVSGARSAQELALGTSDADLAALLTSIAVWRTWAAADLAEQLDEDLEIGTGKPYPPEAMTQWPVDSRTVVVVDSARYSYEVVAARSEGARRDRATARTAYLRTLTEAAVQSGTGDPRRSAYGLGEEREPAQVAAAAERRLLDQWVFRVSVAPRDARPGLLDAALHTAGELRAWGGEVPTIAGVG